MLRNVITATLTCFALDITSVATATDKHGHDHDHKPLHGGIVAEAAGFDFELVGWSTA